MVIDLSGIDDVRFILGYHKAVKLFRMQHSSAHHRNFADGLQDSPPLYLWEPRANPQGHTHLSSRCSAASRTHLLTKTRHRGIPRALPADSGPTAGAYAGSECHSHKSFPIAQKVAFKYEILFNRSAILNVF